MKKLIFWSFILLLSGMNLCSCTDSVSSFELVDTRNYQMDAQILSKFVDINKDLGLYYINENKKNSPLGYILLDEDRRELQKVNPSNRGKFESELKILNAQLTIAANDPEVSQIVYNVYGETWVRSLDKDASVLITEAMPFSSSRDTRSTYSRLQLAYKSEQIATFNAGKTIQSVIKINMFGFGNYYFDIVCKNDDASKTPSGNYPAGGGSDPKKIVMTGSGSIETYNFTWRHKGDSSDIIWEFRGTLHSPSSNCLIVAEFKD